MSAAEPTTATVGHFTLTDKPAGRLDVLCTVCNIATDIPPTFGGIPQKVMAEEFVKLHLHKDRKAKR